MAFRYYAFFQPHEGLSGATPAERFLDQRPAHVDTVPPPRGRPGELVALSPPFEIRHLDGERHLPYLVRKAA